MRYRFPKEGFDPYKFAIVYPEDDAPDNTSLVLIYPPGETQGRRLALREPCLIGSGDDCEIRVVDAAGTIAGHHARLMRDAAGGWHVRDEGSASGTFVQGAHVGYAPLACGNVLQIGAVRFLFLHGPSSDDVLRDAAFRMAPQTS